MPNQLSPDATRRLGVTVHPIVLADGKAWGFALPVKRLITTVVSSVNETGDSLVTINFYTTELYVSWVELLREHTIRSIGSIIDLENLSSIFEFAGVLLRIAHDISEEEALTLLNLGENTWSFLLEFLQIVLRQPLDCPSKP